MKKFFIVILGVLSFTSTLIFGVEITPEYFLMERLIMLMEVQPTYVSNDGLQELKALQIDKDILSLIGTNENPFYVYDSNGEQKLLRIGDYFISPLRLSSIYTISKDDFENNFRDKSLPEKSLVTQDEVIEDEKIDVSQTDAGVMNDSEI